MLNIEFVDVESQIVAGTRAFVAQAASPAVDLLTGVDGASDLGWRAGVAGQNRKSMMKRILQQNSSLLCL